MAKRKIDYLILIKFPATYGCHIEYYGKGLGAAVKVQSKVDGNG